MDECNEYKAGFCTKTEFFVEKQTQPCPYRHVNNSDVSTSEALKIFKEIINETEERIKNNQHILELKGEVYDKMNCTDKLKDLLMNNSDNRLIIKAIGLCIKEAENDEEKGIFVCNICGAFMNNPVECNHIFHIKYKFLREVMHKIEQHD